MVVYEIYTSVGSWTSSLHVLCVAYCKKAQNCLHQIYFWDMKLKPNCLSLSCIYSCINVGFNYDIFISLYQFFFIFYLTSLVIPSEKSKITTVA